MRCPNHPQAEATGYCSVCGGFGCPDCLFPHEGNILCERHYRPIAKKIEDEKKQEEMRRSSRRQRLVVRYLDGRREYGVSFALNIKEPTFHLHLLDAHGVPLEQTKLVRFADLKAVFLVKSFDGQYDKAVRYREWAPQGAELVVRFKDGEVVRGFSLHKYEPGEARFHLVPQDPTTNNISILVETLAVEGVYTPLEYEARAAKEKELAEAAMAVTQAVPLSQEETTGDFYFETRNYQAAYEQYKLALAKHPNLRRLVKKLFFAQYNLGVFHIKRREYAKALAYMEGLLQIDPRNESVQKKVMKLRHIVSKTKGELS